MENVRQVAIKAAREAGAIHLERLGKVKTIDYKSAFNLVTEVDQECEKQIIATLKAHFPDHQVKAEESGAHAASSEFCWHVDPLDGTTNFAHGYPFFCVSIGLTEGDKRVLGVVYNALTDE